MPWIKVDDQPHIVVDSNEVHASWLGDGGLATLGLPDSSPTRRRTTEYIYVVPTLPEYFDARRLYGGVGVLSNNNRTLAGARGAATSKVEQSASGQVNPVVCVEFNIDAIHGVMNIAPVNAYALDHYDPQENQYGTALTSTMYFHSDGSWSLNNGTSAPTDAFPSAPLWVPGTKVGMIFDSNDQRIAYFIDGVLICSGNAQYYTGLPWLYMADAVNGQVTVTTHVEQMAYVYVMPVVYGGDRVATSWPYP